MKESPNKNRRVILFIIGFAAASLLVKFFLLYGRFLYIDPDEGYYLLLARNLMSGLGYTFNGLPNIQFPPFLPILISCFYFVIRDLQLSLIIITTITGTLLGYIIYLIAREKFASYVLLLCAFLGFFIYQLNAFIPTLVPYTEVLYRGSDILNLFLLFTSLYFVLLLVKRNEFIYSILAGLFFALSYLTRPEGFLMFAITLGCLVFLRLRSLIPVNGKRLLAFTITFVIAAMPYVLYLKSTTGKWTLSGKIFISQTHRKSLLSVVESEDWTEFHKYHFSLNKEAMEMSDSYWGYYDNSQWKSEVPVKDFAKDILAKFKLYYKVPKILFSPFLVVFFLLGICKGIGAIRKKKSIVDILLLLFFPYSVVITALAYPVPRHHLFLVPVFCIYTVEGLVMFFSWLEKRLNVELMKRKSALVVFVLLMLLVIGNDYFRFSLKNYLLIPSFKQSKVIESEISRYLKDRKARVIMSTLPTIPAKAFSDWQVMPRGSYFDIIQFGKRKKVEYVILKSQGYKIVQMEGSYIPEPQDTMTFEIIDRKGYFDLLRIVKKSEPEPQDLR